MVSQIYLFEFQLNKVNYTYTEAPFKDFDMSITHGIVSN